MTWQSRTANALIRRLQQFGLPWPRASVAVLGPSRVALAHEVLTWIREYLGQPHPELGRAGAVCPYAQVAVNHDSLYVAFDETDGASRARLRASVLAYARRLSQDGRRSLDGLMVVFPQLPAERYELLDEVHSELKTYLMVRGIMVSAHHPRSTRPAIWNPDFKVLRAPFPAFALRTMDVRDIVFVAHNRRAFARYREWFGPIHAAGRVPDPRRYGTAYSEALKRFGHEAT